MQLTVRLCEASNESDDEDPVVGRSNEAASTLRLFNVLSTIAALAFEKSKYPLFVMLDVDLSPRAQLRAREMLIAAFGTKLYRPADDPTDWTIASNVPTPAKLLEKIVLVVSVHQTTPAEPI